MRTITLFSCAAFLWLGGFLWFWTDSHRPFSHLPCTTQAIVILTGGSNRISEGLRLLEKNQAPQVLISGVPTESTLRELKEYQQFKGKLDEKRITLEQHSQTTQENSVYSARWIRQHQVKEICLVTSCYHMRRSLLEFRSQVPDVKIIPHIVYPRHHVADIKDIDTKTLSLYIREYHKLIGAYAMHHLGLR